MNGRLAKRYARALLDLVGPPESVRWALSDLEQRAFTAAAIVTRTRGAFSLRSVRLESGPVLVRGALEQTGSVRKGAFLVRRGALRLGVELEDGRARVVAPVDEEWLSRQHGTAVAL